MNLESDTKLVFPSGLSMEWFVDRWIVTLPSEVSMAQLVELSKDIQDALVFRKIKQED